MRRGAVGLIWGLLLAAALVSVGLAHYLGPNRTVTTTAWERRTCGYQAVYDPAGPGYYACTLELYYAPSQRCPSTSDVQPFFNPDPKACGPSWPGTCGAGLSCKITKTKEAVSSCNPGQPGCTQVTRTTDLPPATVSGTFSCATPGDNGWCRGGASLDLTASEPLAGYVITLIESASGVLCDPPDAPNVSCSWTGGGEGNYTVTFWAHSSYGDTSGQASAIWKVDGTPPTASFTTSGGAPGANGWYRAGPVTVTATGSDAVSGLASAEVSVDGGPWAASAQVSGDGVHTVDLQARDRAGNVGTGSGTVRIDGAPPSLSASESGPAGLNGWYVGPVDGTATASDALSGLDRIEHRLDGRAWTAGSSVTVAGDGTHTLEWRAFDVAGNSATTTRTVRMDATAPVITDSLSGGTAGANGWYTAGPVDLTCTATDATSGLDRIEYRADGGAWGGSAGASGDGVHTLECRAFDQAGNRATVSRTVPIDGTPPVLSLQVKGTAGAGGWYVSAVTVEASASDALSGVDRVEHRVDGGTWQAGATATVGDGVHRVAFRALDAAGNQATASREVRVDATPPTAAFTTPDGAWAAGLATLEGTAGDAGSGVASAEISLDGGGSWTPVPLDASGRWSHTWDTRAVPDGTHTLLVRARDAAGNVGQAARLSLHVDNTPPRVSLTPAAWRLGERATVEAADAGVGLEEVRVTISGNGIAPATFVLSDPPATILWDGRDGAGRAVPHGTYAALVEARDRLGNVGTAQGEIRHPLPPRRSPPTPTASPPPPAATWTPTAAPPATAAATATRAAVLLVPTATGPAPSATPARREAPARPAAPAAAPVPEAPQEVVPSWALAAPALALLLAAAAAASAVVDPRPRAWRWLAHERLSGTALEALMNGDHGP